MADEHPIVERGVKKRVEDDSAPPPPRYRMEGPLKERRLVKTPWGDAWAEEGTYVAERLEEDSDDGTGEFHIVHPDDRETQYVLPPTRRTKPQTQTVTRREPDGEAN